MRFGIYDTKDNCWIGDDKGPKLFDPADFDGDEAKAKILARVAAQVIDVRLKQAPGRLQAREYDEKPKVFKDEIATHMTSLDALKKIEDGAL